MAMASMEKEIATAEKGVLVEIVKLAQKRGLKGASGTWKDFLKCHDRKFGDSICDPAKRSVDILTAFLQTFTQEEDIQFSTKVIRRHRNHKSIERLIKDFPDQESPQQRLVRLTREHPQYTQYYSFPSFNEEWMTIRLGKISKVLKCNDMIAIDCEMVLCQDGTEAVVKVCAVDHNLEVKLDKLVNPNKPVADYRTQITGLSSEDFEEITCSLVDIQKSLKKLLSHGTILVGHSLHSDLQALKVDHARFIDTVHIFKYRDGTTFYRPSLNNLCKSILGSEVRKEGEPHNCLDDARAAMKLVRAKLEQELDDPISVEGKKIPEMDRAKLLLHRISTEVPTQELLQLFSEYNVTIQHDLKIRGQSYSTYAVFKDARHADKAFEEIEGREDKDCHGLPQKHVILKLTSTGEITSFYIRKMVSGINNNNDDDVSKKRLSKDETGESKRQRTDIQLCNLVKEVERLTNNDDVSKKRLSQDMRLETGESKRQRTDMQPCDLVKEIERLKHDQIGHVKEINRLRQVLTVRDIEIERLKERLPKQVRKK